MLQLSANAIAVSMSLVFFIFFPSPVFSTDTLLSLPLARRMPRRKTG
jgi:hypothetical protein